MASTVGDDVGFRPTLSPSKGSLLFNQRSASLTNYHSRPISRTHQIQLTSTHENSSQPLLEMTLDQTICSALKAPVLKKRLKKRRSCSVTPKAFGQENPKVKTNL